MASSNQTTSPRTALPLIDFRENGTLRATICCGGDVGNEEWNSH